MTFGTILFIMVIIVLVLFFHDLIATGKRKDLLSAKMLSLRDFTTVQKLLNNDYRSGVMLDELREKFAFISVDNEQAIVDVVPFKGIVGAEIVTTTVASTNTTRHGGILTQYKMKSDIQENVSRIMIRVSTNKMSSPTYNVVVYEGVPLVACSSAYDAQMNMAYKWLSMFDIASKRAIVA